MDASDRDHVDAGAFAQLGDRHQVLLDSIDNLRALAMDELPQIVVVGDKSSGKSSVLEAISRLPFPVNSSVCTRCPTELVMRKSQKHEVSIQIIGEGGTTTRTFLKDRFTRDDLPNIITEARDKLGIEGGGQDFSTNILRIHVSDPNLKDLTLIDLPGIYHSGTSDESPEGITIVQKLAEQFMAQPNTIILAVVCGSNDMSGQQVLMMAKECDPKGERTVGVLTKPDAIPRASSTLSTYVRLVRNEEEPYIFKLGWHVLRNRSSEENDELNSGIAKTSDRERDEKETRLLSTAPWTSVGAENKGVDALRAKLSNILTRHVQTKLPSLIRDMEKNLRDHEEEKKKLGGKPGSDSERRNSLSKIAARYRGIALAATNGSYEGAFFSAIKKDDASALSDSSNGRMLRAVVRNVNCAFSSVMYTKGAKRRITWDDSQYVAGDIASESTLYHGGCFIKWLGSSGDETQYSKEYHANWVSLFQVKSPGVIAWSALRSELEAKAADRRGTEFPGSPNDKLALDLFRDQIENWHEIAHQYLKLILKAARAFVQEALAHILGPNKDTYDVFYEMYIAKFFRHREVDLLQKLEELICHYREGTALCLEAAFERRMQERNSLHAAFRLKSLLLSNPNENKSEFSIPDISNRVKNAPSRQADSFGCEMVVEMMATYYDMSMRTFTENVIILGAENCLIKKIPDLLDAITDHALSLDLVNKLTAESPETTQKRQRLESEIAALEKRLQICEKYNSWNAVGRIQPCLPSFVTHSDQVGQQDSPARKAGAELGTTVDNLQEPKAATSVSNGESLASSAPNPPIRTPAATPPTSEKGQSHQAPSDDVKDQAISGQNTASKTTSKVIDEKTRCN